ncbi:MAG TPA: hypothetical protein VF210_16200 [Pseudomonadales bacterium]
MNVHRVAAGVSIAVVAIAALAGFLVSGTPGEQRLKRLDAHRVADLQNLARAVERYWYPQHSLPTSVDPLVDGLNLSRLPTDPVTGTPYRYERLSADSYRLCADFARPSEAWEGDDFWRHPAGTHCYTFKVPPDGLPGTPLAPR